jgi:hypothetical protein
MARRRCRRDDGRDGVGRLTAMMLRWHPERRDAELHRASVVLRVCVKHRHRHFTVVRKDAVDRPVLLPVLEHVALYERVFLEEV